MAVNIPTLSELYTSILADLESQLGVTIPLFGKIFLRALAAVQAGKLKLIYLLIGDVQKNISVDLADPEAIGGTLERFGRIKLGRNPFPATPGTYTIEVTGDIGATIPANTTFKSNDDALNSGKLYILDSPYVLVATTDSIDVRALEPGLGAQLNIGDKVTATAPIINVDSEATVTVEVIQPLAAEDIEDYRDKAIDAYQLEAQGGAATDYRLWASDAQGVAEVYPYLKTGVPNEIEIFVEATKADSIDGKGTPSAQLLQDVEDVIEFDPDVTKPLNERGRRPLGLFDTNIQEITVNDIDIEVVNYQGLTVEKSDLILNALTDLVDNVRPFVDSADILANKNDILSENSITFAIIEAVPGSVFTSVILKNGGSPVSSIEFDLGEIPNLKSVSYV